jgi:hypothetical protein
LRDILYPANFDRFRLKGTFSTDTGHIATLRLPFAFYRLNERL